MILVERIHNYARYRHDQGILGCCHLPIALTVVSGLEEGEISSPEYPFRSLDTYVELWVFSAADNVMITNLVGKIITVMAF